MRHGVVVVAVVEERSLLIVVAEDDAGMRLLVGQILRATLNAETIGAVDGEHCLRVLRNVRPDLLIVDVDMPVVDGLGVARALRADPTWTKLPILAMSGSAVAVDALAAGCDAFIAKPFRAEQLADAVRAVLPTRFPREKCRIS